MLVQVPGHAGGLFVGALVDEEHFALFERELPPGCEGDVSGVDSDRLISELIERVPVP